jgi:RNA polymerase sigma factor (sigma-70 family)
MQEDFPALADLKAGSDKAWTIAFARLWPVALRAARQSTLHFSALDAEEAASDAICSAVAQIDQIRGEPELFAFIAVVARRKAISMLREKLAAKRGPENAKIDRQEPEVAESCSVPGYTSTAITNAEMVLLLYQALSKLDVLSKQLLLEKYVEGFSYEELSRKHKIPVGTLCPKLMRALEKLRRILQNSPELMKELHEFLR